MEASYRSMFQSVLPALSRRTETINTNTISVGECSSTDPGCPVGYVGVGEAVLCDKVRSGADEQRRRVCCPFTDAPSGESCEWSGCKCA
ncbi:hypothetical protein F5X97DRAFT_311288, partial [Nemania serpens]